MSTRAHRSLPAAATAALDSLVPVSEREALELYADRLAGDVK